MSFIATTPDPRALATSMQSGALENLLAKDASKVAQIYPWVADLKDSDIPDSKIVKAMIETENVTWMEDPPSPEVEDYAWKEKPEFKETPQHLDHPKRGCVHKLPKLRELHQRSPSDDRGPESGSLAKTLDVVAHREQAVFKHCGIAGVLHPKVPVGNDHGSLSFRGDCASLIYGRKVYLQPSTWWTDTSFDDAQVSRGQHLPQDIVTIPFITAPLALYRRLNTISFRTIRSWLGKPAAWHQSAMGSASFSSGPLGPHWRSDPFGFFRRPSKQEKWNPGLLRYCVSILKELLLAMEELNKLGGCCNSFPILIKQSGSRRLAAVDIAFESVWRFVQLLSKPLTMTDNPQSVLRDEEWRVNICQWTLDNFKHLFGSEDEAVFFLYRSTRIDGIASYVLHMAALCAQIFSVGLATFCRGHCSDFYMPLLSRTIEKFHLFGAVPTGPYVIAERAELSCLGDMLHRPVWVFRFDGPLMRTDLNQINPAITFQRKRDVHARISQIFDIWGASIEVDREQMPDSFKLCMGGGFLSEVNTYLSFSSSDPMLHWSATDDGRALPAFYLENDPKVIVGAVSANANCGLRRNHCERPLAGSLVDLRAHPGGWKPLSRTKGLAGGPGTLTATFNVTEQRFHPTFMKGSQVQQWNKLPHNLTVLNAPWGLEFSLCTGVARRVPLRALLNETVVSYLQSKLDAKFDAEKDGKVNAPVPYFHPKMAALFSFLLPKSATEKDAKSGAQTLDRSMIADIQQAASNDAAAAIWTDLKRTDSAQFNAFATALEFFMEAIQCSRVDDKNNLLLWWPEPNNSTDRGIKLDQSWYNGNSWISVLEDTESCAIFGLATCTCLEDGKTGRACQNLGRTTPTPRALTERLELILNTGIAPEGGAAANMNLIPGQQLILNSYKAERHVVRVRQITASAPCVPCVLEYRGLWSRPAVWAHGINIKVLESAEYMTTGLEALVLHRQP